MAFFSPRVTATILFVVVLSSYLAPLAITYSLAEDEWVTIFDQDYSKIDKVPINIQASNLEMSKRTENNYLLITKNTEDSGTVNIYGLIPTIKCRYTLELNWSNTYTDSWSGAGVYIGIGGAKLHCYATGTGSKFYLRGQYLNSYNDLISPAFLWDMGKNNQISITIETDTSLGKAYISDKNNKVEIPYYRVFWFQDKSSNIFTPDTISLIPTSANSARADDSTVIKLFRVTQEVKTTSLVTAIGSTKYQAFGYDGPHPARTVSVGMDNIRNAKMNATLFADVDYVKDPTYLQYLKDLVAAGWELGIHFSMGLSELSWADAKILMANEYAKISELFGTKPLSWCSLGNIDNATHALWAKNNLNMLTRSYRVVPQNLPGSHDIVNSNFNYWLGAAKSGVSTAPIYAHETDIEPAVSPFSIDRSKFDVWLNSVVDNGIRLVGYNKWYMINSNQLDAKFDSSVEGNNTTITVDTNGYNAIIIVKIKADLVTAARHSDQILDYSKSPEGYMVFEVVDGGKYTVTTKPEPVIVNNDVPEPNNLPLYLAGLIALILIIIFIVVFKRRISKHGISNQTT